MNKFTLMLSPGGICRIAPADNESIIQKLKALGWKAIGNGEAEVCADELNTMIRSVDQDRIVRLKQELMEAWSDAID